MRLSFEDGIIRLDKQPGTLDRFTWAFLRTLDEADIKYTLISGYVAILFGRNRSSEDIDVIIEPLSKERFERWWRGISEAYECLNTSEPGEAYGYLKTTHAIRFSKKGTSIPNMELKFPKTSIEEWVLTHQQPVTTNDDRTINVSPIELQIAYKLFLGSEKDIEDATFLHELFREHLNKPLLQAFVKQLKVQTTYEEHLR